MFFCSQDSFKFTHHSAHNHMKDCFLKIFSPILRVFEKGQEPFTYIPSHRKILVAVGTLFTFLSAVSVYFAVITNELGALIPILVFFIAGLVCLVVGFLGNERAVAKIWGNVL